jgi:hypothetical protein
MIAIWNQKEVFTGYSLQQFNEVRGILAANNINYKHKLVNNISSRRGRTGTFGENLNYSVMYYIYVHKKDYQCACTVLRKPR